MEGYIMHLKDTFQQVLVNTIYRCNRYFVTPPQSPWDYMTCDPERMVPRSALPQ